MCKNQSSRIAIHLCKRATLVLSLGIVFACRAYGQETPSYGPEYVRITEERAEKIVRTLKLEDLEKSKRVQGLIAKQYQSLHDLQAEREKLMQGEKEPSIQTIEQIKAFMEAKQMRLHFAFFSRLEVELDPKQIDQIKDGITYHVLPKTYQQYLALYPTLDEEQKRTILSLLLEAREFAVDAGSSEEKHAWFGKYKGRINNYLSAAGLNAKEAERALREKQRIEKEVAK